MPVIVQAGSTRTIVVDRARTASVTLNRPATTRVSDGRTATALQQRASVVEVASPGPQGPKGDPGISGGNGFDRIAPGHALGGHRVVRSLDDSVVDYADCTSLAHGDDTLGMTLAAADPGAPVQVLAKGPLTFNGWNWTAGEPVFLDSNGLLTQTPREPVDGAAFVQVIGFAETPTTIQLGLEPPVYF